MMFAQTYRNWLLKLTAQPANPAEERELDELWNSMEEELILDEAWTEIDAGLGGIAALSDSHVQTTTFSLNPALRIVLISITSAIIVALLVLLRPERINNPVSQAETENTGVAPEKSIPEQLPLMAPEMPSGAGSEDPEMKVSEDPVRNFEAAPGSESPASLPNNQPARQINDPEKQSSAGIFLPDNEAAFSSATRNNELPSIPELELKVADSEANYSVNNPEEGEINKDFSRNRILNISPVSIGEIPASFLNFGLPDITISAPSAAPASFKKWRLYGAGISLSYNNSWILNDETLAGLEAGALIDTRLSYAPEIGLSTVFVSGKGQRIELEYFFLSNQNQRLFQYIDALYQERKISLNYQKFHVSWQFPVNAIRGHLGLGSYFSYLTGATEIIAGEVSPVKDLYYNYDYGISFEYKKGIQLFSGFILAPSLRAQYSLNNIFRGSAIIPSTFRKTHNASLGINLGIYYAF